MTRLDAALLEEHQAKKQLLARISELTTILGECERATRLGIIPSVRWVPAKAESVVEAARIWDATQDAVVNIRIEERFG